jgi:hypothetical protein
MKWEKRRDMAGQERSATASSRREGRRSKHSLQRAYLEAPSQGSRMKLEGRRAKGNSGIQDRSDCLQLTIGRETQGGEVSSRLSSCPSSRERAENPACNHLFRPRG